MKRKRREVKQAQLNLISHKFHWDFTKLVMAEYCRSTVVHFGRTSASNQGNQAGKIHKIFYTFTLSFKIITTTEVFLPHVDAKSHLQVEDIRKVIGVSNPEHTCNDDNCSQFGTEYS